MNNIEKIQYLVNVTCTIIVNAFSLNNAHTSKNITYSERCFFGRRDRSETHYFVSVLSPLPPLLIVDLDSAVSLVPVPKATNDSKQLGK